MINIKITKKIYSKLLGWFVIFAFLANMIMPTPGFAQNLSFLPTPGTMVTLTPSFAPVLLRGVRVNPKNPFELDFIVDVGDTSLNDQEFEKESEKLIKYFLASLTIPESDLWVNLSPYEEDRIIPDAFSQTEMGRDLLAQDYILKQITASLIYPEDELGKQFWSRIYKQAFEQYGTTQIPVNTFNKVWIVPERAVVYENGPHAFVVNSHLKVMLEEDYLSLESNIDNRKIGTQANDQDKTKQVSNLSSQIVREIVLPEIEKEVNNGKNFASLRQIYNSLILATWFKNTLKDSILNQKYSNQAKISGVDVKDKQVREKIYNQYLDAFKKGVCDFVKVEYDQYSNRHVPRKYFSGGVSLLGNTEEIMERTGEISKVTAACSPMKLRRVLSVLKNDGIIKEASIASPLMDVVKKALVEYPPSNPAQCVKASRFIADRLIEDGKEEGVDFVFREIHVLSDPAEDEAGAGTNSHTVIEIIDGGELKVVDTQNLQIREEYNKKGSSHSLTEEFTSKHVYPVKEYYSAIVAYPTSVVLLEEKIRSSQLEMQNKKNRLERFIESNQAIEFSMNNFSQMSEQIERLVKDFPATSTDDQEDPDYVRDALEKIIIELVDNSHDSIVAKSDPNLDIPAVLSQGEDKISLLTRIDGDSFIFEVKDTGVGILSPNKEYKKGNSLYKGGQGVGLKVSRRIMDDYFEGTKIETALAGDKGRPLQEGSVVQIRIPIQSMKVSSPTAESLDKDGEDDKIVLSQIYEGMKEYLDPVYTAIDNALFRYFDDNQGTFTILGIGYGVSNFLKDIKGRFNEKVSIWTNDKIPDEDGAFLNQPSSIVKIVDDKGFQLRADKVISLIDCRSDDRDIFDALQEWKNAFDQVNRGGNGFSAFVFSQTAKGSENQKLLIDFLSRAKSQDDNIRFLEKAVQTASGDKFDIVYVRNRKQVESEIEIKQAGPLEYKVRIHQSLVRNLNSYNIRNIFSRLGLGNLPPGLRNRMVASIRASGSSEAGFDPKIHQVYGVKALVNSATKDVVFFSQSQEGTIQSHEDVARSYFGKLSGDIFGYQMQILLNSDTNEVSVIGAQVDSKLMRMPTLYDPDKGGKEITEKSVIAANKILFDGISMKKMFDSEIQIEVHQDFLPFISDARKFSWSKEKTLSVLKVYSPSSKIESRFFKNQNNVNSFKQLYSNYFKIYLKNLEAKHAIDEDLRAKGREVEKDEKFFQEEFQNLGFILSYVLLKSFFSKDENTQNEFKLFLRDIRDFIKIMNENKDDQKGNQDKEVNEIIKRIGRIFLKYINSNMDEIDNVPKDLGPITSDPGFASELNIDGATRGSIVHDLRGRFANFSGYFGLLQTEYSEYMNGEDILAEEAKRVLFLACNLITKSRKSYHDFFNFRVLDQDFKLGDNAFQVVGFDQFSNPKEVRKEIKPFRQADEGLFGHYWPQQLKESQYLFSIRDIGGNLYDDGQPIVLLHVEKDIKPVIKAGDQAGAVSFSEKDETENREVYNVRKVLVNPKYQDKLRKQGYSGIQISQLLVALVGQWAQDQSSSQDVVFLYEPFGEKDNAISQKLFNVQPVSGLEAFLTSNFKSIDKFLREMLDQVVVINKRSSDAQNEIAFEQEFKNDDEGGEGDALVDHSGIVVTKQNPMLVVFSYKGTSYYYNRAETLIRPMGNTEFVRPETNDEIYPKLMAALEAEKNKTSSGIIPREIQDLASLAMQRFPPSGNNQCKIATDWIMETSRRETDLRLSHDFRDDTIFIPLKAGGQREHVVVDVDGEWIIDTQLKQFEKDLDVDKEFLTRGAYDKKEYYQKVLNSAKSSREDSGTSSGQDQAKKPNFSGTQLELPFGEFDESSPNKENLGGIDLGAETLEMEVQSQGERFEFNLENLDFENIEINGLYPVIINVAPVTNLPAFLGAVQEETDLKLSKL